MHYSYISQTHWVMADKTKAAHNTKFALELPGTVSCCCKEQQPWHQLIPLMRKAGGFLGFLGFLGRAVLQHPSKLLEQNVQQNRDRSSHVILSQIQELSFGICGASWPFESAPQAAAGGFNSSKKCPVSTGPLLPLRSWELSCCIHEHATKKSPTIFKERLLRKVKMFFMACPFSVWLMMCQLQQPGHSPVLH